MGTEINTKINHFLATVPDSVKSFLQTAQDKQAALSPTALRDCQNLNHLEGLNHNNFVQTPQEIKSPYFFETLTLEHRQEALKKGIKLFLYIDPNLPTSLKVDTNTLSLVLQELMNNAIKFTPKGGSIHLDIRQNYINEIEHLSLSVSDTGVGIPEAKITKLFTQFQGPSNTGSGLGLATCYFLLEKVGSHLKISSELLKGSRFSFSLAFSSSKQSTLAAKKSLRIGILQKSSDMDEYTRQIFTYLIALGSKLLNIDNHHDPKIKECQVLFIINKSFNPREKNFIHKNYPNCLVIPAFLEKYHKNFSIFKRDQSYKILFPLLPSAMLDCYAYITSEIALKKMQKDTSKEEALSSDIPKEESDALRILLVEDNAINIKWTLMLLGRYDYDIDYAENGEIAVAKVKEKRFDLILMDIDMPIMNGIEATQHIKAFEKENRLSPTPIVALTSHDQEGEKEKIIAQGLDEHLGKPLKLSELEALLAKYNKKKSSVKL